MNYKINAGFLITVILTGVFLIACEPPLEDQRTFPDNQNDSSQNQVENQSENQSDKQQSAEPQPEDQSTTLPRQVYLDVPFSSQAPYADWGMPYQEACEEASIIMVRHFLEKSDLTADTADREILTIVAFEKDNKYPIDTTAAQTLEIAREYYGLDGEIYYDDEVTIEKIKELLSEGHPVIIPAQGQMLGNPNFSGDGPPYHMLVITGYDNRNFITNDPGTRKGEGYKYSQQIILNSIHDWTGDKSTMRQGRKAMFILK